MKKKKIMEEKKERVPNIQRAKNYYEFLGFHILNCDRNLRRVFDFQADTIYSGANLSILVKVQAETISRKVEEDVRGYRIKKGKEIWLIKKYGESKHDPKIEHVYRFEGSELIQESEDLSFKDALEKAVKSTKSPS